MNAQNVLQPVQVEVLIDAYDKFLQRVRIISAKQDEKKRSALMVQEPNNTTTISGFIGLPIDMQTSNSPNQTAESPPPAVNTTRKERTTTTPLTASLLQRMSVLDEIEHEIQTPKAHDDKKRLGLVTPLSNRLHEQFAKIDKAHDRETKMKLSPKQNLSNVFNMCTPTQPGPTSSSQPARTSSSLAVMKKILSSNYSLTSSAFCSTGISGKSGA